MNAQDVAFALFASIAVLGGLLVVFLPNILHAAFSLIVSFFGVAGLYVLLSADFVAVIQVLLYIGGVVILIVFAVMLSDRTDVAPDQKKRTWWTKRVAALCVGALVLALLYVSVMTTEWREGAAQLVDQRTTIYSLGNLLLTDYLLPFEIASILLLGALIGSIVIARQR
ncbi:MAG: NADH-quinone oxidoreductase subunit J [Deltaproteobacteria bacterium]|nr:NADH-quinone oxidoreductase subunit J [Deltaproteobacteria bacterium]